jgi:hypothetical protein
LAVGPAVAISYVKSETQGKEHVKKSDEKSNHRQKKENTKFKKVRKT